MENQVVYEIALAILVVLFGMAPLLLPRVDDRLGPGASYGNAWKRLAALQGLAYEPGKGFLAGRVEGIYRGRLLTLSLSPNDRFSAQVRTYFRLSLRQPLTGSLLVRDRRLLGRLVVWLRQALRRAPADAVELRFETRSDPEQFSRRLLASPALRRKLLQAGPLLMELEGGQLCLSQRGIVADRENVMFLFDLLNDSARLLERD